MNTDLLITESAAADPLLSAVASPVDTLIQDAFGLEPVLPVHTVPAGDNPHGWVAWRVRPAYGLQIMAGVASSEKASEQKMTRACGQVTAVDGTGAECVLTADMLRTCPPKTVQALFGAVELLGTVTGAEKPHVVAKGDGLLQPITVRLSGGKLFAFRADTWGQIQDVAAGAGDTEELLGLLADCCSDPDAFMQLVPVMPLADLAFVLKTVAGELRKKATKTAKAARSYQMAVKGGLGFTDDTRLPVIYSALADYADLLKKRAAAQKAAARKK